MSVLSKKQELLTLAAKIIQEDGMQKLTMDYLAKKAGITKGGVLYHFESKGVLLQKMNKMEIEVFDKKIQKHMSHLRGAYRFTRAYALATLEYLEDPQDAQMTAVFISSLEYKENFNLWRDATQAWGERFLSEGESDNVLKLQLICDGIWFSIMYEQPNLDSKKGKMKNLVLEICHSLEQEEM